MVCVWTTISGQNRSFQWATILKVANAVAVGQALGRMTRQTMPPSPIPSSRAAWISSSGMDLKAWRNMKMANTDAAKGAVSAA